MIKAKTICSQAETHRTHATCVYMLATMMVLIFNPAIALAAPETVGQLMKQTSSQFVSSGVFNLIGIICYTIGAIFTIQTLNGAIGYASPNANVKLSGLAWRAGGAAAFLNLPLALGALNETLFKTAKADTTISNKIGDINGVTGGLDGALVKMVTDLQVPLTMLVGAIAFLSGLFMIGSGILAMSNINYAQDNTPKKAIIARLGVGTALTAFATSVETILTTMFQSPTGEAIATLAYDASAFDAATGAKINGVLNAIFIWLALIGLIAILRGLWNLKDLLEKGGGLSGPLTHLIAGGMLVNMGPAVRLIEKTLDVPGIT